MSSTIELSSRYGMRTENFSSLMQHRVREILLVASQYDAFALEEDGQLTELLFEQYRDLDPDLQLAPQFSHAANGAEALAAIASREVDLVVAAARLPDMSIETFLTRLRKERPDVPIGLLATHTWDLPQLEELRTSGAADLVFLWQGDVKVLLAMIKQVEDRRNAEHDVLEAGVQVIILVEDEVRFYSVYLPHIYTEVTSQTSRLMAEGLNLSHRLLRLRARPKILLTQSYEEALAVWARFSHNTLGIISDIGYPRAGRLDPTAGLSLVRHVRSIDPDLPLLLQSHDPEMATAAREAGAEFLCKSSPTLLGEIRRYIKDSFGFGDFVFRLPERRDIARAADLRELVRVLEGVPPESVVYHASRNHFSAWLKARTEFELASLLRPRKVSEFPSGAELKQYLIAAMTGYLGEIQRHVIADFEGERFDSLVAFSRIGTGSLGGKGRGLAFMHRLLAQKRLAIDGVEVGIPQTVVLASDLFQSFMEESGLRRLVAEADRMSDEEILNVFRRGSFPAEVSRQLSHLLRVVDVPLAVRSSSLLEDSVSQPFAGVYATVMLPNSHPSLDVRLAQLLEAIKVVYASTYFKGARSYLETTPFRVEEEQMAVLVQRLVGSLRGGCFYPTFSGVACSYNFYPFRAMRPEDGVAQLAVGLGKSIVEGLEALRVCPRYPQVLPQLSTVKDMLKNAQRRFYALDMSRDDVIPGFKSDANLLHLDTREVATHPDTAAVLSTYVHADNTVVTGTAPSGTPLVTFSPLLHGRPFPVATVVGQLLNECQAGMGSPVEIELAADLRPAEEVQVLNVLQVRPMVIESLSPSVELKPDAGLGAIVYTEVALGHGRSLDVADVIVVDPEHFDRAATSSAATIIERINRELRSQGRRCLLVGPGRWGSQDPWLGIPVSWSQISTVRAIVETDFADLEVEPSQGSHFFHNLACFRVAFLAAHSRDGRARVDWGWFHRQPAVSEELGGCLRHLRLCRPVQILVDGASGRGVILPG